MLFVFSFQHLFDLLLCFFSFFLSLSFVCVRFYYYFISFLFGNCTLQIYASVYNKFRLRYSIVYLCYVFMLIEYIYTLSLFHDSISMLSIIQRLRYILMRFTSVSDLFLSSCNQHIRFSHFHFTCFAVLKFNVCICVLFR